MPIQDLSNMSIEELMKVAGLPGASPSPAPAPSPPQFGMLEPVDTGIKDMSDQDLMKIAFPDMAEKTEPGMLSDVADAILKIGKIQDKYGGAPTRAAVDKFFETDREEFEARQRLKHMYKPGEVPRFVLGKDPNEEALKAFKEQWAEDPEKAPTGKQIAARRFGLSEEETLPIAGLIPGGVGVAIAEATKVSPAGFVGFFIDLLADVTNVVPFGAVSKLIGKSGQLALKGSAAAVEALPVAGSALRGGREVTKATKLALSKLLKPKVSDDWVELADIAKKNNIETDILPAAHKYGPESIITRMERAEAEGLLGQEALEKFTQAKNQVENAVEAKIQDIGKGVIMNKAEAGDYLRDAFDQAVKEFFSGIDVNYSNIIKQNPGLRLGDTEVEGLESMLRGIEKFAKGRAERGITEKFRRQGKSLLNTVEALRANNYSIKQLKEALVDMGEAAFESQRIPAGSAVPPDIKRLKSMYHRVNALMIDTIRKHAKKGEEVANKLVINNRLMEDFIGDKNIIARVAANPRLAPESVFNQLLVNTDTRKIGALKKILEPDQLAPLKASMFQSMIKKNVKEEILYGSIKKNMDKNQVVLERLFKPDELKDLVDLIRLGDRFGIAVMSTSGTGASNTFRDVFKAFRGAWTNKAFIDALKRKAEKGFIEAQKGIVPPARAPALEPALIPPRGPVELGVRGLRALSVEQPQEKK